MSGRLRLGFLLSSMLFVAKLPAQLISTDDQIGNDFLQPQIAAGYSAVSERFFKDVDGTFNASTTFLAATIPIYNAPEKEFEPSTSYFLLARSCFSSIRPDISFLPSADIVYRASLGMTGGFSTEGHHLYLLTFEAGIAEDGHTVSNPRIRPTGSLLGKYHLDDSFAFFYGLSYSYIFNRGLLLPLLGTHCTLARDLEMHLMLPLSMEIDYQEAHALHFGLVIRADGDQIHIEDNGSFATQSLPLFMKIAQLQGAFSVSVELSGGFWLSGEAGVLRNRSFAIGTLDDNFVSSKIENSGYSTIILKYEFGHSMSWRE